MIYGIKKTLSDTYFESTPYVYLYESEKLRNKVFVELLEYAKNFKYTKDLFFNAKEIKYFHSGNRIVEYEKIEYEISTEENFDKDVFK